MALKLHALPNCMRPSTAPKANADSSTDILNRIRERWLSNMLHDLSNPLFAARGYVRLALEQRDSSPEAQRRYLNAALENLHKLASVAQELGSFREIDELEFANVNIRALLEQIVRELGASLAARGVLFTAEIADTALLTAADARKLSEAVRELLSLAVEFTEPGSSLHIRATEENEKVVIEFRATRVSGQSPEHSPGELLTACRIWRLHGGICTVGPNPAGVFLVTCELPIVRLPEC